MNNDWPHAPPHRLTETGTYMVTGGTYKKAHLLSDSHRLDFLQSLLFSYVREYGWELHAWAILSNHYHFVASSPGNPENLKIMLSKLHTMSAREFNRLDQTEGRKVWYQYYDTHITFQPSYYARLKYVSQNPVHHGVSLRAENYRWCSAGWFERTADSAFRKTIQNFGTGRIKVQDVFDPVSISEK